MDDLLFFGKASAGEWKYLYQIISSFGHAFGFYTIHVKSMLIDATLELNIVDIFVVEVVPIDLVFKYIDFHLKSNNYGNRD